MLLVTEDSVTSVDYEEYLVFWCCPSVMVSVVLSVIEVLVEVLCVIRESVRFYC